MDSKKSDDEVKEDMLSHARIIVNILNDHGIHFWMYGGALLGYVRDGDLIPWLNLIEVTSEVAKKRGVDKPLVVGAYVTVTKQAYDKYLDSVIYLTEPEREKVYNIIERLKNNEDKVTIKKEFYEIVKPYKDKVNGIIIACTEPSMLFELEETEWNSFQIIDSTNECAKRCVEVCKGITL